MTVNKIRLPLAAILVSCVCAHAQASDIFNGREVYDMHCQTCHGMDGRAMEPGVPDFSQGESLFAPDADLVRLLREGDRHLPTYRGLLSDDELRDVVAYIRTLQR